ncbi:MAG: aldo/keto reductase [Minicystis sp.]
MALAWLLARPEESTVIVGARTVARLQDNLAALGVKLTAEDVAGNSTPGRSCARQAPSPLLPPARENADGPEATHRHLPSPGQAPQRVGRLPGEQPLRHPLPHHLL